MRKEQIIEQV